MYIYLKFKTYKFKTGVSQQTVGAILNVLSGDEEKPVAFSSRQLRGPEVRYSVTEPESVAIVAALYHFVYYLHGTHVKTAAGPSRESAV